MGDRDHTFMYIVKVSVQSRIPVCIVAGAFCYGSCTILCHGVCANLSEVKSCSRDEVHVWCAAVMLAIWPGAMVVMLRGAGGCACVIMSSALVLAESCRSRNRQLWIL